MHYYNYFAEVIIFCSMQLYHVLNFIKLIQYIETLFKKNVFLFLSA